MKTDPAANKTGVMDRPDFRLQPHEWNVEGVPKRFSPKGSVREGGAEGAAGGRRMPRRTRVTDDPPTKDLFPYLEHPILYGYDFG